VRADGVLAATRREGGCGETDERHLHFLCVRVLNGVCVCVCVCVCVFVCVLGWIAVESMLFDYHKIIRTCFSGASVEEIVSRLNATDHPFAKQCLQSIAKGHPTALKLTHRLLSEARVKNLTLAQCMKQEYRVAMRLMQHGDYMRGVRAFVIDRDHTPAFKAPAKLEQVTADMINPYFAPFATAQDELIVRPDDYAEIFHETYSQWENLTKDSQTFIGGVVGGTSLGGWVGR
jgi:hypothetical protein